MLVNNSLVRDSFDAYAWGRIQAIEAADGQPLEPEIRRAIHRFVKGCKKDSTWTAIKTCCILAGARTLAGALVPLVGAAPTNFNFVSGDYNRKTGLLGNGTNKYLDSQIADNSIPRNSHHLSTWVTQVETSDTIMIGSVASDFTAYSQISRSGGARRMVSRITFASLNTVGSSSLTGFLGLNRTTSSSVNWIIGNTSGSYSLASNVPTPGNYYVFARNVTGSGASFHSNARLSFYSIGESINLSLLNNRVSALMTAFNRYIP